LCDIEWEGEKVQRRFLATAKAVVVLISVAVFATGCHDKKSDSPAPSPPASVGKVCPKGQVMGPFGCELDRS
jgi:hypothetical protein